MSKTVGKKTKAIVAKRDGGHCFYCGLYIPTEERTVDHVIPKSKGGPNKRWNLVLSCYACNQAKGDSDPIPEYLDMVLRRKILHETQVSVGQAIELAKLQRNAEEVKRLLETLWRVQDAIRDDELSFAPQCADLAISVATATRH